MRKLCPFTLLILMFTTILSTHAQDNFSNTKWQLMQIKDSNVTNSPIVIRFYNESWCDFYRESNVCNGSFAINKDSINFTYRACTRTMGDEEFSLKVFQMIGHKSKYILSANYLTFITQRGTIIFQKVEP